MANQKICVIEGCGKKVNGRDWCNAHYQRWLRHGDPLGGEPSKKLPLQWLQTHKNHRAQECLIWPFHREVRGRTGYVTFLGTHMRAARVMCYLAHGKPFKNALAIHLCGTGRNGCVNPTHLKWGTAKQNQLDRLRDGTDNRGEKHGLAKLTRSQVLAIREMAVREELSYSEIARRFGVTRKCVSMIADGKRWAWLKAAP